MLLFGGGGGRGGISPPKGPKKNTDPGELFRIPMVLIGQMNGTVPRVVHSSFRKGDNTALLGHLQESQIINVDCTLLNYSIFSTHSSVILTLFPHLEFHDYEAAQLIVSFCQCPPAFVILYLEDATALSF